MCMVKEKDIEWYAEKRWWKTSMFLYVRRKSVVLWYGAVRPSTRPHITLGSINAYWIHLGFRDIILYSA